MHRTIKDRFSVTLRTESGNKFRGEFGDPNSYPRPRKEIQNLPHLALVTSRKAVSKAGDLVSYNGVKYLLCGQHTLTDTKRYIAVEITEYITWVRISEVIDHITRMKKDDEPITLAKALPVTIEPTRSIEELKFSKSKSRVFTAADVQVGDLLDGLKVLSVVNILGINAAEVA